MSKDSNPFYSVKSISIARKAPVIEKIVEYTLDGLDFAQKAESVQVNTDPYYTHMPKNDPAAATLYASNMGREHHDNQCEIF